MLAVCRARGWPTEGYRLAEHPLQRELLAEVEAAAGDDRHRDRGRRLRRRHLRACRCEAMARAFAGLETLDAGDRVAAAMRAHPELIRGERAADTMLMRALPGWIAKGGAEGLMCAAGDGLGVALKAEDGAARALRPALAAFLGRLGHDLPPELRELSAIENSRGEPVGEIVAGPMKNCFRTVKNSANIRSAKVSRGRCVPALCASPVGLSPVHPAPRKPR